MNRGVFTIHLAAQYLAAAGISFVDKKEDDSHTNLGYSLEKHQIQTWPLNESQDYLALDLIDFTLKWGSNSNVRNFELSGSTHQQAKTWIQESSGHSGLVKPYNYSFHYNLPYGISENHTFEIDQDSLALERELRSLAQTAILKTLSDYNMESSIRIWPHHFDTGALAYLPDYEQISIGLGLAIPDSLVDEHYFYISGYRNQESIDPSSFRSLAYGRWVSGGFIGGVLPAKNVDETTALQFFQEAIGLFVQADSS